ncbi:MAG: AAA family ATPase [Deltaproteobacteria bacterium]|nr:AAA family ATPase [Deltaproteobacteria bacterium]
MFSQIPIHSFAKLIKIGGVYVDKTGMLLQLVKSYGPFFLARPRRFGKSLLLDTIRQIFEGRKELFAGLEIQTLDPDFDWEPFPVIRINMNTVSTEPDEFKTSLIARLLPIAESYKVEISKSNIVDAISDLITKISMKHVLLKKNIGRTEIETDIPGSIGTGNVVLLIDEYDFPLLKHLRNQENMEKIRLMLYDLYSAIKGCDEFLRFVFITGITKFKQLSLFSALNNVIDLSFDKNFTSICGFTEKEITSSFGDFLDDALTEMIYEENLPQNSTVDNLMDMISEWYDGYSWDGKNKVFNPFSIKTFLYRQNFSNYWYESGKSLFADIIDSYDGNRFSIFGKNISLEAPLEIQDTSNIKDEAFLLQAGYLTIDRIVSVNFKKKYLLKIPNFEIRNAINEDLSIKFKEFISKLLFINDKLNPMTEFTSMKNKLLSTLWSRDIEQSEMLLSSIFSGIPKEWYRGGGEGSYKLMILTLLRFGGAVFAGNMLEALGEAYSDSGRADLLFDVSGNGYAIIEMKYAKAVVEEQKNQDTLNSSLDNSSASVCPGLQSDGGEPAVLTGLTRLLELGKVTDKVKRVLENKIEEAFSQILVNNYAKPYLASERPVLAVAIAVYGTSTVMVRFAEAVWNAEGNNVKSLTDIPTPATENPRSGQ